MIKPNVYNGVTNMKGTTQVEKNHKKTKISPRFAVYFLFFITFITISYLSIHFIRSTTEEAQTISFKIFEWPVYVNLIILFILYFLVDALRFHHILKTVGVNLPFMYTLRLHFIYLFASSISPFTTGGGVLQLYFLTKRDVKLADSTAAITIRTIVSILFFITLMPVALLINHDVFRLFPTGSNIFITIFTSIVILSVIILGYLLVKKPKRLKTLVFRLFRYLRQKKLMRKDQYRHYMKKSFWTIDRFSNNLRAFRKAPLRETIRIFIYTFLYIIILCSFTVVLIKGVNPGIDFIPIISLQFVGTFVTYFVPTPGATGAAEGIFYFAFSEFTPEAAMTTLVLFWRFFTSYIGAILGLIVTGYEYVKARRGRYPYLNGTKKDNI